MRQIPEGDELTPQERAQVAAILDRWRSEPGPAGDPRRCRLPMGPSEDELLWGYGRRLAQVAPNAFDAQ